MADLMAPVVNGQVVQQTEDVNAKKTKGGGNLDKDDFLQLLVAQMKYQYPLQPASNTEYVSQFATFSELEQMQNVSQSTDMNRASNLIGQIVTINNRTETGEIKQITGTVDYVMYQNNKAMLSVKGGLYSIDELASVTDAAYYAAGEVKAAFESALAKLPKVDRVTEKETDSVQAIIDIYDKLTAYEKSMLSEGVPELVESYRKRLAELKAIADSADKDTENTQDNSENQDDTSEQQEETTV